MKLEYRDFHRIRKGDKGWTQAKQKARIYYSPSTNKTISLREFQAKARGATYKEFVQQRVQKGEQPKKYKTRILEISPPKPPKEKIGTGKGRGRRFEPPGKEVSKWVERSIFFKNRYAKKISEDYGYELNWKDMPEDEKTLFWKKYHELVDKGLPSENQYAVDFEDYFGEFDDGLYDIEYGETP